MEAVRVSSRQQTELDAGYGAQKTADSVPLIKAGRSASLTTGKEADGT